MHGDAHYTSSKPQLSLAQFHELYIVRKLSVQRKWKAQTFSQVRTLEEEQEERGEQAIEPSGRIRKDVKREGRLGEFGIYSEQLKEVNLVGIYLPNCIYLPTRFVGRFCLPR